MEDLLAAEHLCLEELRNADTPATLRRPPIPVLFSLVPSRLTWILLYGVVDLWSLQKYAPHLVCPLLLHEAPVVAGYLHSQLLLCLHQELHPRFTLLQEGLVLQQESLKLAVEGSEQLVRARTSWEV